jgi:L-lactate dehydrogenase complex protein LldG
MSGREAIMNKVRAAMRTAGSDDGDRRKEVNARLANTPAGIIPARGQLPPAERIAMFRAQAEKLSATVQQVRRPDGVPKAIAEYLRARNLPSSVRMGDDPRLTAMPWDKQKALEILHGPSDGYDEAGVSHAASGIAETGTLVMTSGHENPTTVNFLPEHHIVVVDAAAIDGDLETAFARIRKSYGKGVMPRTVNLISGPSRSGDVEQKIILGAHGPRALHIIVVG